MSGTTVTRGGAKRAFTRLELRRRVWDAMKKTEGTKRPGSTNRRKGA